MERQMAVREAFDDPSEDPGSGRQLEKWEVRRYEKSQENRKKKRDA